MPGFVDDVTDLPDLPIEAPRHRRCPQHPRNSAAPQRATLELARRAVVADGASFSIPPTVDRRRGPCSVGYGTTSRPDGDRRLPIARM